MRKFGFQLAAGADGQLGEINTSAPWGRCGSARRRLARNEFHIRSSFSLTGVSEQSQSTSARRTRIWGRRRRKVFCGETGRDEFVQPRLEKRSLAGIQSGNVRLVEVESDDLEMPRTARGSDAAEMPEAEDGDIHRRWSTHWFLLEPLERADDGLLDGERGFPAGGADFLVSRKMNGLSPIQPLLPPLYSRRGFNFSAPQMKRMESLTCTYSSAPSCKFPRGAWLVWLWRDPQHATWRRDSLQRKDRICVVRHRPKLSIGRVGRPIV